jgi:DNA-binding transcriptional regulator YhcF (GntR family)
MTVRLSVDLTAATPVYEQLRAQIAGHIGAGLLRSGDRLPTVRGLSADLGIAVNTVGRAYAELEAAGLVKSGRRAGTVVTGRSASLIDSDVTSAAMSFAAVAARHSLSDDTAIEILRHALQQIRPSPPPM